MTKILKFPMKRVYTLQFLRNGNNKFSSLFKNVCWNNVRQGNQGCKNQKL